MSEKKTINKKSQRYHQRLDRTSAPLVKQSESVKPSSDNLTQPVTKIPEVINPSGIMSYYAGSNDVQISSSGYKKKGKSYGN